MSILRNTSTAVAISVAGAGIAIGGVGLATADDNSSGQSPTTQISPPTVGGFAAGPSERGEGWGHGPGARGGPGELSAQLAEALGLPESDVTAALQAVRDQLQPEGLADGETRTWPTETERADRLAQMSSVLADELGVSEQQVTEAFESLTADRMTDARSFLADRLDAAVTDGRLTEADKQSVLKAFEAGVLGGERPGPHGSGAADEGAANS